MLPHPCGSSPPIYVTRLCSPREPRLMYTRALLHSAQSLNGNVIGLVSLHIFNFIIHTWIRSLGDLCIVWLEKLDHTWIVVALSSPWHLEQLVGVADMAPWAVSQYGPKWPLEKCNSLRVEHVYIDLKEILSGTFLSFHT